MKMSVRFVGLGVSGLVAILLLAGMTPVLADGSSGRTVTRLVVLPKIPGAPVVIDSAYVDIMSGPNGELDAANVGCVRYRNLASESIVSVRFERTYLDASSGHLGSDSIEDHTKRKPNRNALPGTGPVAAGYWDCTHTANPYGAKVVSVSIQPVFVKFLSGKTWRLP